MTESMKAVQQCRSILGKEYEPMRLVWNDASIQHRRFFLRTAKLSEEMAGKKWDELSAGSRLLISAGVGDLCRFLEKNAGAMFSYSANDERAAA